MSEKRAVDAELSAARVQARRRGIESAPRVSGTIAENVVERARAALACNAALAETRHQARFAVKRATRRIVAQRPSAPANPCREASFIDPTAAAAASAASMVGTHESESMVVRKVRMPAVNHPMFGDVELEDGAHVLILRRHLSSHYYGIVLDGESAGQTGLFLADACLKTKKAPKPTRPSRI